MERVGGRQEKMEGHCSTGQSPQWAVVPMEEEELLVRLSTVNISHNAEKTTITYSDLVVFVQNIRPTVLCIQTTATAGGKVFLEKETAAQLVKIFTVFDVSQNSLLHSKNPILGHYCHTLKFRPHPHTLFLYNSF